MSRPVATRRQILWAWAAVALCVALIGSFSTNSFSSGETGRFLDPLLRWLWPELHWRTVQAIHLGIRKAAHFTEYALLAILACRAIWLSVETSLGRIAALSLFLALLVALADETHQAFTPTRGGSPWDVALDLSGALAAVAIFLALRRASGARGAAARHQG